MSGFTLGGHGFSRRRFLQLAGSAVVASYFDDVLEASVLQSATAARPALRGIAKNCIVVFLWGAPSQVDTFDLKEGPWTPAAFEPTSYGDIRFPKGLLPGIAEHLDKIAIIRSGLAWAAVHSIAQTWSQIGRNPAGANANIAPHVGAVVSLEMQSRRRATDVLPAFVALNYMPDGITPPRGLMAGNGYFPSEHAPLVVSASTEGIPVLKHPDGDARLARRWSMMDKLRSKPLPGEYAQARRMLEADGINDVFRFTPEERLRYGNTRFAESMVVAKKLIAADRGTRFVQVTMGNWDMHGDIYQQNNANSIFGQSASLDPALAALLADLAATPGSESGKTLLDETLVAVFGEFGRTVGPLNGIKGRDHYLRMSLAFAGGGVKGGRVIGATDALGANAKEFGWKADRDVRPEDVTATIYSALGIDYTTMRRDDPLGRGFEYVPFAKDGIYEPVDELFG